MAIYKMLFNPLTGDFDIANDESSFHVKENVASYANLPITGNGENDMRFTSDTDDAYVWSIADADGLLTDWKKMPLLANMKLDDIVDGTTYGRVKLSEIVGGQIKQIKAVVADIVITGDTLKDATDKKHSQGTDQALDTGGLNQVTASDAKDAVTKKHTHGNQVQLDLVTDGDHDVRTDNPHGVDKTDVGLSSVDNTSDATKLTNTKADVDIADALSKKHSQGTDQGLDTGGANAVTASQAKAGYTHSGVTSGNPHNVTKSDVGLSNVANVNNSTGVITFIIDGNGGVIATGEKGWTKIPFACTLTGWTLTGNPSGSIKIDIWKDTYANFPPQDSDSITNGHEPQLVGATKAEDTHLSDWSDVTIDINDYIKFNVDSVASCTYIELVLNYTRT